VKSIGLAGGFEVQPAQRRVLRHGEPVVLGARAFDLLLVLLQERERVIGRDELIARVWPGVVVEDNNLTVQISSLRKVFGTPAVTTVAGRGYRFTLPTQSAAATDSGPLLAVLAFDNHSGDAEMQYFSDGVSEEIIRRVARGSRIRVIGRTSSFQFRGERKAEAADRLACSHVLDGSIHRASGRVRISAHLMDAASRTTVWSDRFDHDLQDIFAVQDEIAERIGRALDQAFTRQHTRAVDPQAYDLYLRTSPRSYSPDELRGCVSLLEKVTAMEPQFAAGWGRLAYLRSFTHLYRPFAERAAIAAQVADEASSALVLDTQNIDALAAQWMVMPPFGRFIEGDVFLDRLLEAPGEDDCRRYIGWMLRQTGRLRESLVLTERSYALNPLDPMTANLVALARMASGHVADAVPVYEGLVERIPDMSFPLSSLLRAQAFLQDWERVDQLLALAAQRPLREFQDTIPFVRAKRDPSPANIGAWRSELQAHVTRTGRVDVARLVFAAHLGLVDEAYEAADRACLGPAGTADDIMGPDGYRTALLFQAGMPELRNDQRFPGLCARLGLVEFWLATDRWPDCAAAVPYDFKRACERVQHVSKERLSV
jgi:TolB-like protein/tetratricopeptide (TPR) repeat protein